MKYELPKGITVKETPLKYTKETKLVFIDEVYGEFQSTVKAMQDAGASTHPKAIAERRKKTNLERYGVVNPTQNKDIRQKVTNTIKERYGTEHALQNPELLKKSRETLKANHGVSHMMEKQEFKDKQKKTFQDKYGVDNPMHLEQHKRYGSDNPMSDPAIKEKHKLSVQPHSNILPNGKSVKEYCENNDIKHSMQNANKLYREYGPEFAQEWIENYEVVSKSSLEQFFKKEVPEAQYCNQKINNYRPDFKLDKLYIDVDGLIYHSDLYRQDKYYHFNKRKDYAGNLLQFRQDEVLYKVEIVKSIINSKLGKYNNKFFARKLTLKEVSNLQCKDFFNENHLMGNHGSAACVALFDGTTIVAAISYRKHKTGIEISRFCSKLNTLVVGGLSKLLNFIIKKETPDYVLSFVDLRYGNGESLSKLGFTLESTTLGWKWTDGSNTFNRLHCRANMDERGLSEAEHAKEMKLYKIYDAGQAKFVKDLKNGK
jgi:hypothetical protein